MLCNGKGESVNAGPSVNKTIFVIELVNLQLRLFQLLITRMYINQ